MANDPAFLFYPGDYLRDTQCLSEKSQVAYDRIMCEHMRNICISQDRLEFFTKRLSESEKQELTHVLTPVEGGYAISWVAESIRKRKSYSASRRKNRVGKPKKHMSDISSTYDSHMENENENENEVITDEVGKDESAVRQQPIVQLMADEWRAAKPGYPFSAADDLQAIFKIGEFLSAQFKQAWLPEHDVGVNIILRAWNELSTWIVRDDFYSTLALSSISKTKNLQTIWQKSKQQKNATGSGKNIPGNSKQAGNSELIASLEQDLRSYG